MAHHTAAIVIGAALALGKCIRHARLVASKVIGETRRAASRSGDTAHPSQIVIARARRVAQWVRHARQPARAIITLRRRPPITQRVPGGDFAVSQFPPETPRSRGGERFGSVDVRAGLPARETPPRNSPQEDKFPSHETTRKPLSLPQNTVSPSQNINPLSGNTGSLPKNRRSHTQNTKHRKRNRDSFARNIIYITENVVSITKNIDHTTQNISYAKKKEI